MGTLYCADCTNFLPCLWPTIVYIREVFFIESSFGLTNVSKAQQLCFSRGKYKSRASAVDVDSLGPTHSSPSSPFMLEVWSKQLTSVTSGENLRVPGSWPRHPPLQKRSLSSLCFRGQVGSFPGWSFLNSNLAEFIGVLAATHSSPIVSLRVAFQSLCVNWIGGHSRIHTPRASSIFTVPTLCLCSSWI